MFADEGNVAAGRTDGRTGLGESGSRPGDMKKSGGPRRQRVPPTQTSKGARRQQGGRRDAELVIWAPMFHLGNGAEAAWRQAIELETTRNQ